MTVKKSTRGRAGKRAARKGKAVGELDESAFASLEIQLRKTVAELGLDSARKIFASVEAAFSR
jgi:hypothetical protein